MNPDASEYDQEMPQSLTTYQPMAPWGRDIYPTKQVMHTVAFLHSFYLLDFSNLINKTVPSSMLRHDFASTLIWRVKLCACRVNTCRFVVKLHYDINEYQYLYLAWKSWTISTSTVYLSRYGHRREKTCLWSLRTTKTQTSLCIRTVWSVPLLFPFCKVSYLDLLPVKFHFSS